MTETVPKKFVPVCVAIMLIYDQLQNNVLPTFAFLWVTKYWYWLYFGITFACSVPQVLLVYLMPDSPMVYYEEEDFKKAKEVYKSIATMDGLKLESFKFDEEIKLENSAETIVGNEIS